MDATDAFGTFITAVQDKVDTTIDERVTERFSSLEQILKKATTLEINVNSKIQKLEGLKHRQLNDLVLMSANRLPTLVVGPAGTGKTHAAEQVAEGLGLKFYAMSVGAQTSKSDIVGFINASGTYQPTGFREAYENGGVFLMDEIDAGNSNVLIILNSALSNSYCAFPDKMVKRHEDFVFIGSANTVGNGADRVYVGRNQLDAATLDRFVYLNWDIDTELERIIVAKYNNGEAWHSVIQAIRGFCLKNVDRAVVTPRATMRGAVLLDAGMSFDATVTAAVLGTLPAGKHTEIRELARNIWSNEKVEAKKPGRFMDNQDIDDNDDLDDLVDF